VAAPIQQMLRYLTKSARPGRSVTLWDKRRTSPAEPKSKVAFLFLDRLGDPSSKEGKMPSLPVILFRWEKPSRIEKLLQLCRSR